MHIQLHSGAQQGRRGEVSPALFENWEKCHDFGKKYRDCVHHWVKFSIQNLVLRVSRRKKSKMFFCGAFFFLCFWWNLYQSALVPHQTCPSCPEKFLVAHLHSDIILFGERSILNVWKCSEYFCLNNCSLNCTVTLCYVLRQIHSE